MVELPCLGFGHLPLYPSTSTTCTLVLILSYLKYIYSCSKVFESKTFILLEISPKWALVVER